MSQERESFPLDVLFVGGGPACLAGAIHLSGLVEQHNAAVEAGSVDGYAAVLDDDIELLPTDAETIRGIANYRAMLEGVFTTDDFRIEIAVPI